MIVGDRSSVCQCFFGGMVHRLRSSLALLRGGPMRKRLTGLRLRWRCRASRGQRVVRGERRLSPCTECATAVGARRWGPGRRSRSSGSGWTPRRCSRRVCRPTAARRCGLAINQPEDRLTAIITPFLYQPRLEPGWHSRPRTKQKSDPGWCAAVYHSGPARTRGSDRTFRGSPAGSSS